MDDDGVILLDDSSDDESEEDDVRMLRSRHSASSSTGGGSGSSNARTVQSARKSTSTAFSTAKTKSAPVAARKAAPLAGYASDERSRFVIRNISSSSSDNGGGNNDEDQDEYDDGDASFDESTAFGRRSNKRKRPKRLFVSSGGVMKTHRKSEYQQPAKKSRKVSNGRGSSNGREHSSKASKASKAQSKRYVSEDDSSGSSNDVSSSSGSGSDSDDLVVAPRVKPSQVNKKNASRPAPRVSPPPSFPEPERARPKKVSKSQTAAAAGVLSRKTEYINVLSDSSDKSSTSSSSEEEEVIAHKKTKKQRSTPSGAFDKSRSSSAPRSSQQTARKAAISELPREPLLKTNGASATTPASVSYRRPDRDFHRLTEKLSYNELQAQRRALEQISLMHKRSGGFTSPSAPQVVRQKPNPRLESRKSVVKQSRVDEIEKRATAKASNTTPAKPTQEQPTIAVAPPSHEVVIPTTMLPSSISSTSVSTSSTSNAPRATSSLKSLSSNRSFLPAPAMHTTAWRRVRLGRAPPNILSPEAKYSVPFSDGTFSYIFAICPAFGALGLHSTHSNDVVVC